LIPSSIYISALFGRNFTFLGKYFEGGTEDQRTRKRRAEIRASKESEQKTVTGDLTFFFYCFICFLLSVVCFSLSDF